MNADNTKKFVGIFLILFSSLFIIIGFVINELETLLAFAGCGLLFGSIGVYFAFEDFFRERKNKFLLRNGIKSKATFRTIAHDHGQAVNYRAPYVIHCNWVDERTGIQYIFKSQPFWYDPFFYIDRKQFDVFVDPHNSKKYYLDTRFLPKMA